MKVNKELKIGFDNGTKRIEMTNYCVHIVKTDRCCMHRHCIKGKASSKARTVGYYFGLLGMLLCGGMNFDIKV